MSEKKKMTMFEGSIYTILTGVLLSVVSPLIGAGIMVIGGSLMGDYFLHKTWFDDFFENAKLGINEAYPRFIKKEKTETGDIFYFTLPCGLSTDDFERHKLALEQYRNCGIEFRYEDKRIIIEEYFATKHPKYDYVFQPCSGKIHFPLGYDKHKKIVTCNLSAGNENSHMIIAGTTGGGKTVCVKSIITSLILSQKCDLYLFDMKGCELNLFRDVNRVKCFCNNPEESTNHLENISREMQNRYEIFGNVKVGDILSYNKAYPRKKLKHITVVIDEFAVLSGEKNNSMAIKIIEKISALGRAAGISLILSTQRPDSVVFSSRIKCNCNVILGLKTTSDANSRVVFDDDRLTKLKGKGHAILRYGGEETELQTMYIDDVKIKELIKPYNIEKKDVQPSQMTIENVDMSNIF